MILKIMVVILFSSMFLWIFSCSKYQVVSELDVHLYHLHNPKTNQVEVIVTEQQLKVGQFYRLKSIKTIDIDENE